MSNIKDASARSCKWFKTLILVALIMLTTVNVKAQQSKIDLLFNEINELQSMAASYSRDTILVNKYNLIAGVYEKTNLDSLLKYSIESIALARKIVYAEGEARGLFNQSIYYRSKGIRVKERDCLQQSLRLYEVIGNKAGMASCYSGIGIAFKNEGNLKEALDHYNKALLLYEEIGSNQGIMKSYYNLAYIYATRGQFEKGIEYYEKNIKIAEQFNDKNSEAYAHNGIGAILEKTGNYDKSLSAYFASLKIFEEEEDKKGMSAVYANIGNLYSIKNEFEKAQEFFDKSRLMKIQLGDKNGMASTLISLGTLMGRMNDNQKALNYYLEAEEILLESGNKKALGVLYNNLHNMYQLTGNSKKAIDYIWKSIEVRQEVGDKQGIASAYTNLSITYRTQNRLAEADTFSRKALEIAINYNIKPEIMNALKERSILDSARVKWKDAYEQYKSYSYYKDSIFNETSEKQMNELQTKYETEKKEQAIKILTQENHLKQAETEKKDLQIRQRQQQISLLDKEKRIKDLKLIEQQNEIEKKNLFASKKESELKAQTLLTKTKESEVKLLSKDKEIQQKEINRQKLMRNGFIGGFTFVLIFAGVFLRQRNRISKEKQRSENLLLNILPAEVAEELKSKGKADAKDFDLVTILFTDFKEFTQTSEKMTAQELVSELNTCFEAFDRIIERNGIEKIKTIGDAYMAAGGIPVPSLDSAMYVVVAAMEMRDFIVQRKLERDKLGKPAFEMRIGIHTGPVVAGIVGVKKFQYDIWGDTVNTASRIESAGEPGRINLSHTTFELVKDNFNCNYRGEIEVKGKGKLKMYFVNG